MCFYRWQFFSLLIFGCNDDENEARERENEINHRMSRAYVFHRGFRLLSSRTQALGGAIATSLLVQQYNNRSAQCELLQNVNSYTKQIPFSSNAQVILNQLQEDTKLEKLTIQFQLASKNILTALRYCERIFEYILYGFPVLFLAPTAYYIKDISPATEDLIWIYIIWTIEQLGPTFVKFAQWASTRYVPLHYTYT